MKKDSHLWLQLPLQYPVSLNAYARKTAFYQKEAIDIRNVTEIFHLPIIVPSTKCICLKKWQVGIAGRVFGI